MKDIVIFGTLFLILFALKESAVAFSVVLLVAIAALGYKRKD